MRTLLLMLFLVTSATSFAQSKKELKVPKAKIETMKTIHELITDLPKNCKVSSFVFSTFFNGSLKEYMVIGDGISPQMKHIIKSFNSGMIFNIMDIKSECPISHKDQYKVTVE